MRLAASKTLASGSRQRRRFRQTCGSRMFPQIATRAERCRAVRQASCSMSGKLCFPKALVLTAHGRSGIVPIIEARGSALTKSELIAELAAANPHLRGQDVETIVATIFDEITYALARGERVELRGFGAF